MKYLPLNSFSAVTNALNFSTPDCHVIGGCDVYTTKAAGSDRKLYKSIEHSLESQFESLVRLSASLSPRLCAVNDDDDASEKGSTHKRRSSSRRLSVGVPDIDLSRSSPFGSLKQISARKTFAYLIATLNASHPDYDFSQSLRPADFQKEASLRRVMYKVDSTLQNLRPNKHLSPPTTFITPLPNSAPLNNIGATEIWNPKMWSLIDKEMGLRDCEKYSYVPDEDPFEGEEGALWSMHYFFFNKTRKRVCYLYLRALSVISHSPVQAPLYHRSTIGAKSGLISVGDGAGKRASYWLGQHGLQDQIDTDSYGPDDDDEVGVWARTRNNDDEVIYEPGDDEVDVPHMDLDEIRADLAEGNYSYDEPYYYDDNDVFDGEFDEQSYVDDDWHRKNDASYVRGMSEEIGASMDMDVDM